MCMRKALELKKCLQKKTSESFRTETVKQLTKFYYWTNEIFPIKARILTISVVFESIEQKWELKVKTVTVKIWKK